MSEEEYRHTIKELILYLKEQISCHSCVDDLPEERFIVALEEGLRQYG